MADRVVDKAVIVVVLDTKIQEITLDLRGKLGAMEIVEVTSLGIVELELSMPMIVEHYPKNLNETHLLLTIDPYEEDMQIYLKFSWETIEFK